jgi:hypothetical protein
VARNCRAAGIDNVLDSYSNLGAHHRAAAIALAHTDCMDRLTLTPGRLYARLSAEFRRLRPGHCGNCRMPMVQLTHRASPEACNWGVEEGAPLCERCAPLVAALVADASTQFDLCDPVSVPYFPRSARNPGFSARR